MKYNKFLLLSLCLLLAFTGCAQSTVQDSTGGADTVSQTVDKVTSPYLTSQGVEEQEQTEDSEDTTAPAVDSYTFLKDTELLAEGEITAVSAPRATAKGGAQITEYTFRIATLYKGAYEQPTVTVKVVNGLQDVEDLTPEKGRCMLGLSIEDGKAYGEGTYYTVTHRQAGYLVPIEGERYANKLTGKDRIELDPTSLPGEIALLED